MNERRGLPAPSHEMNEQLTRVIELVSFVNMIKKQAARIANEANLPLTKAGVNKLISAHR